MMFTRIALAALSFAAAAIPMVQASGASQYCYDATLPCGPQFWLNLNFTNNQCGGAKQSPIAIVGTSTCATTAEYKFTKGNCNSLNYAFEVTDHNAGANVGPNCTTDRLEIPGNPNLYKLLQFHVHTSSEHTLDGKFYQGELHMVHLNLNTSADLAVVGLFLEAKSGYSTNSAFECFLDNWEAEEAQKGCTRRNLRTSTTVVGAGARDLASCAVHVYDLIPKANILGGLLGLEIIGFKYPPFYTYSGSLTTPPCSEIVAWNVAETPVKISVTQAERLQSLLVNFKNGSCQNATVADPLGSTSRPTQPINKYIANRDPKKICSPILSL